MKEDRAENQRPVLTSPFLVGIRIPPPYQPGFLVETSMHGRPIVVIHEDGREEEFPSIVKAVVALNISCTPIKKRLRSGEPYLWRGEKIKFRYK